FARPAFYCHETAESCAEGRRATCLRQSRSRSRLLDQRDPTARDGLCRAGRARLREDGGCLEGEAAQKSCDWVTIPSSQHHPWSGRSAILCAAGELVPALEQVVDGLDHAGGARQLGALLTQLGRQLGQQRRAPLPTDGQPLVGGKSVDVAFGSRTA